jgi:hypothetical protein
MASDVDRIHKEFTDLIGFLASHGEVSLRSSADDAFRKVLTIRAASYFEHILTGIVMDFVEETVSAETMVTSLVRNRVVSRLYHTWFTWDAKNANGFFGMFGDGFRAHMTALVKARPDLDKAVKAFLELGEGRNMLAHQNFAAFAMQKTSDEIFKLYQDAMPFIESVRTELRACSQKLKPVVASALPAAPVAPALPAPPAVPIE